MTLTERERARERGTGLNHDANHDTAPNDFSLLNLKFCRNKTLALKPNML